MYRYIQYAWACFEQDRWHVAGVSLAPPAGYNHCVPLIQPLNCRLSLRFSLKHHKNQTIYIEQKKILNKMKASLSHNFIEIYDAGFSPCCCLLISYRIWLRKEILLYFPPIHIICSFFSFLTYSVCVTVCVLICYLESDSKSWLFISPTVGSTHRAWTDQTRLALL